MFRWLESDEQRATREAEEAQPWRQYGMGDACFKQPKGDYTWHGRVNSARMNGTVPSGDEGVFFPGSRQSWWTPWRWH
jgi:hypothetical protein